MISKSIVVAGFAMLLLSVPLKSEVIFNISNNTLSVSSTISGKGGYHGCDVETAKKVPAYIFEIQSLGSDKLDKTRNRNTCSSASSRWSTIAKKESNKGTVKFEDLPEGKYRVLVLVGQAIGCTLTGASDKMPSKSIVYKKETSKLINFEKPKIVQASNKRYDYSTLKIFPNPASKLLTIELYSTLLKEEIALSLVNLFGQTIHSEKHSLDQNISNHIWNMNIQHYPPGAYFIRLQDKSGKQLSQMVIIQNNQ